MAGLNDMGTCIKLIVNLFSGTYSARNPSFNLDKCCEININNFFRYTSIQLNTAIKIRHVRIG